MKKFNHTTEKGVKEGFFEPGIFAAVKHRCVLFSFLFFSAQRKKFLFYPFKSIIILFFLVCSCKCYSQTFMTRNGYLGFFSKTPLENIKAENRQVFAAIDAAKKNIAFTCLVKGFLFQKELMQEHFNENYIESDKYPKASFTGNYTGDVNMSKDGTYPVQVKGQLTLHGITKRIEAPATLAVKGNTLTGASDFKITPADFDIKIPSLVREKISRQMDVHVLAECNPK